MLGILPFGNFAAWVFEAQNLDKLTELALGQPMISINYTWVKTRSCISILTD